ncbi:hypothetical protein JR316_0008677 [Psilocybe cubensis]|nr:hypothetical protein JR316_0008677 [Psilocybe cubensis]KAH9478224.1 hypothetical protein JR316_0008677 [Psilocybe cubensis]
MHHVVENHHKPYNHLILTKAFGKKYNIQEIKKNVGLLKSSTVKVETVRHDLGGANAKTTRPDGHLHFDHKYYTAKTDRERAGTLIHESAHSLFNTHDHFTNDRDHSKIRAISSGEKKRLEAAHKASKSQDHRPITLSGYVKQSDYNTLKAKASHVMHHNSDAYKVLGHLSTYGLLAPMDKDKKRKHPMVDNHGIPSKLVKHGGSMIPISTKKLSDKKHPVINPYTSKPLGMPKTPSEHHKHSPGSHVHKSGSHPPSKIPVHSGLAKIRHEKAKAERLSPDARLRLYSQVSHGAHQNSHILEAGKHAQNSRNKGVVREKPLPPLPHETDAHAAHQHNNHPAAHAHAASQHNHPTTTPGSRSQSRQGAHPHAPLKRPTSPPRGPRAMSPAKRPSSQNKRH